jgi:ribosomal protein S17E
MPISKIFVVKFFQLVKTRRFAEAERVLERIKQKTNETEWNKGYIHALDGIVLAQKSNDTYAFLNNIDFTQEKDLKRFRKEFLKEYKNKIHSDFDRGYYAAWADYMLISSRDLANAPAETKEKTVEPEQPTETEQTPDDTEELAEEPETTTKTQTKKP